MSEWTSRRKKLRCAIDDAGRILFEGNARSAPGALVIRKRAPHAARICFVPGSTASWLGHDLKRIDLPVVCIDARIRDDAMNGKQCQERYQQSIHQTFNPMPSAA